MHQSQGSSFLATLGFEAESLWDSWFEKVDSSSARCKNCRLTMSNIPPDSMAMRRELLVGIIAFVVGFVVMLATLAWLIVHFVLPEAHWWDVLHMCINALMISVIFGGLGFAALSIWTLSW